MHTFKDNTGRDWTVELTIGAIVRIRAESERRFDLFDPVKDNLASLLADDLPTCWEALWYVCSPQARQLELNAEKFGELLADDVLLSAQTALFDEWRDFFRRCGKGPLAAVVESARKYNAKKHELATATLTPQFLADLDQRVERKMTAELRSSLGTLAASLALTPEASPSGS